MKIDLQIQTTFSDGYNTPTEVVRLAEKASISVISITDHDSIDGILEAEAAAKGTNVRVIPGIEISTTYQKVRLHILGYGIDSKNLALQSFLEKTNAKMKAHFISLIPEVNVRLKKLGCPLLNQEDYKNLSKTYYRMPGLALFMKEQGAVAKVEEAFPLIVDLTKLLLEHDPIDAIRLIHEAGGKAVFSHPFAPRISLNNITKDFSEQEAILKKFIDAGLDGLECFTPCHGEKEKKLVLELAKKYNLEVTGGSDWHGFLEKTGNFILNYIPFYLKDFTGVEVSDEMGKEIVDWILN